MQVRLPVKEVGKVIGGHVQTNIDMPTGGYENACPIRMSYVLNHSGFPVRGGLGFKISTGADKLNYLVRVNDMFRYLEIVFGKPDKTVKSPHPADFAKMQGIIVVKGHGWGNAQGHVTLWDGVRCSDTCHLLADPDNGPFLPETASIWVLR